MLVLGGGGVSPFPGEGKSRVRGSPGAAAGPGHGADTAARPAPGLHVHMDVSTYGQGMQGGCDVAWLPLCPHQWTSAPRSLGARVALGQQARAMLEAPRRRDSNAHVWTDGAGLPNAVPSSATASLWGPGQGTYTTMLQGPRFSPRPRPETPRGARRCQSAPSLREESKTEAKPRCSLPAL